ncbi:MAG: ankyrin repeat domain-containing protein [Thermodesulfobacteriota bacterium]
MAFFSSFFDGALHSAIKKGERQKVKQLLENGAAPDEKRRGRTPLMLAARIADPETVSVLLEKGAELETRDKQGSTALMFAAGGWGCKGRDKEDKCLAVVKALLERGADANACGGRGQTAMRYALGASNRRVMEVLREHGATDSCYAWISAGNAQE